ncbi:hypothetical protein BT63DRAFT_451489 [Microthyrium microscopicum]|uniref:Uncharacterized protein n=1 Tax=Microthyrium microscopicum TaxID=703497 RepID=A0A6A6UPR8_9PEZI|nr:hypothetical protein BT63DRAFT_451489 [Microthyrium microscopicum]
MNNDNSPTLSHNTSLASKAIHSHLSPPNANLPLSNAALFRGKQTSGKTCQPPISSNCHGRHIDSSYTPQPANQGHVTKVGNGAFICWFHPQPPIGVRLKQMLPSYHPLPNHQIRVHGMSYHVVRVCYEHEIWTWRDDSRAYERKSRVMAFYWSRFVIASGD